MYANRWQIWALIGTGYVIGIAGSARLAVVQSFTVSLLIALLLPSAAAVIYMSAATILARDPSAIANDGLATTYNRILFGIVLFVVALQGSIVAALAGAIPQGSWMARVPIVMFGALGIYIGNLLPRTRPNLAIGIRTRRTLVDRDAWIRIHRIAGYVAVVLGVLFIVCGAFLSKPHLESVLGPASLGAALLLAGEHVRSRFA